jgi:hypothetical protein
MKNMSLRKKLRRHQYRGLLECPLRSGFVEFSFNAGDSVGELLATIEKKWGTNFGWTTSAAPRRLLKHVFDRGEGPIFGRGEGWIVAVEDLAGAYVLLPPNAAIPTQPPQSGVEFAVPKSNAPRYSLQYPGDVEHGVYNYEVFGRPNPDTHLRMPIERSYDRPDRESFDVVLVAIAQVNGG